MYECFHCGNRSVVWDSDFDFSDYGWDGEGIVHVCHCTNCGAEIEYRIPFPVEEKEEMDNYTVGEYIIYVNGDKFELGRIKSLHEDGAFVCYHEGDTAAKTPYECMHKLINRGVIMDANLGGRTWVKW